MSAPAVWGWRRRVAERLDRVGLLGAGVRAYEACLAGRSTLRPRREAVADGLPVPPARLRVRAGPAHADVGFFLRSGSTHAALVRRLVEEHGTGIERCTRILDFGCGCGRVVRHWRDLSATEVVGCDTNPKTIAWCSEHLPGRFLVNDLDPPLPFESDSFDLAYAFSVFTHLPRELQASWMVELRRLLRPGGLLLVSTLGDHYVGLGRLGPVELAAYERGEPVVLYEDDPGSNVCSAYAPAAFVREELGRDLEHVAFLPAADDARHDLHLFRRPGGRPG